MPHAVSRLCTARLVRASKPFLARNSRAMRWLQADLSTAYVRLAPP